MSGPPWFRLYSRMIDDEKIRLIAFEDRWHFVALCCLKNEGLLDDDDTELRRRKIAVRMGVQVRELDEISRRLQEVGLVDEVLSPCAWDDLQFVSDSSSARVRKFREKQRGKSVKRYSNVSVTAQDTDTDSDTETDNPPIVPPPPSKKWVARPADISENIWKDWRAHRKAVFTATALDGFRREAEKAGWTIEDAMRESMLRGWQGFKSAWVAGKEKTNDGSEHNRAGSTDRRSSLARAIDEGIAGLGG